MFSPRHIDQKSPVETPATGGEVGATFTIQMDAVEQHLETNISTLETKLQEKDKEIAEIKAENARKDEIFITELKSLKEEMKNLREEMTQTRNLNEQIKADNANLREEMTQKNELINKLTERVTIMEKTLQEKDKEIHEIKEENKKLRVENKELTERVTVLEYRVAKLEDCYHNLVHEVKESIKKAINDLSNLSELAPEMHKSIQLANAQCVLDLCDSNTKAAQEKQDFEARIVNVQSLTNLVTDIKKKSENLQTLDILSKDLKQRFTSLLLEAEDVLEEARKINIEHRNNETTRLEAFTKTLLFCANKYSGLGKNNLASELLNAANGYSAKQWNMAY